MKSRFDVMRLGAVALASALLCACGGGGTNTPTTPPAHKILPTLMLPTTSVAVQATTTDLAASTSVDVNVQDQGTFQVYLEGTYTTNGIASVVINPHDGIFTLQITFLNPYDMSPGVYTDKLVVRGCLNSNCIGEMPNSPQTITVTYTVTQSQLVPSMMLESSSVDAQGFVLDPLPPDRAVVNVTFPGVTPNSTHTFVTVSSTENGVANVEYSPTGWTTGEVKIYFLAGSDLGAGNFTDTVTVRACVDAACTSELPGSPAQITVHYVVGTDATGDGYTARGIAVRARAMVWDAARQLFYVAITSDSPDHPNTVGTLDPVTGTFQSYTPVGASMQCLALSADGQYLYVGLGGTGEILRLALPSMALDLTIPVGMDRGFPLHAEAIQVSPDSAHVLGVIRKNEIDEFNSIAVFDDDVVRPDVVAALPNQNEAPSIQWDTANRMFAFDGPASTASILDVSAGGLQVSASQQVGDVLDYTALLLNGRMYTTTGLVYDPLNFARLGNFDIDTSDPGFSRAMALDGIQQKAFFLMGQRLQSFDIDSLAPLETTSVVSAVSVASLKNMIRWGNDGLAFLNYTYSPDSAQGILLLNGPFIHP